MDSIGDRMKSNYENRQRFYLIRRTPVIIRIDGKCFHSFTKKMRMKKPFDETLRYNMIDATHKLMSEMSGAKCAYLQSDEVSILMTDYDTLNTSAWFDYNSQKIVSVSASIFTSAFNYSVLYNKATSEIDHGGTFSGFIPDHPNHTKQAFFDCRAFNIPREEICNYFIWRQQDWIRNSLQMLARSNFSHKELFGKSNSIIDQMLCNKGIKWNDCANWERNGTFILNNRVMDLCPIFTKNREIIEKLIVEREDEQDIQL